MITAVNVRFFTFDPKISKLALTYTARTLYKHVLLTGCHVQYHSSGPGCPCSPAVLSDRRHTLQPVLQGQGHCHLALHTHLPTAWHPPSALHPPEGPNLNQMGEKAKSVPFNYFFSFSVCETYNIIF